MSNDIPEPSSAFYPDFFSMVVQPESSMIIPLNACNFDRVQIRPRNQYYEAGESKGN
jgi:hypothetical protein